MKYIKNNVLDLGSKDSYIKFNLSTVIDYIYNQIPLDYAEMNKIYKNICTELDDSPEFQSNLTEDDEYVYKFNEILKKCYDEQEMTKRKIFDPDFLNYKLINELHIYLTKKSPKKLVIKSINSIKLVNNEGVNTDINGTTNVDWKLHFWPEFTIQNSECLTLHDIIIACYKIKSHKFENWYELYCNMFTEFYVFQNSNDKNIWKEIFAVIKFDHGC
ncbi:hypothetical protein [Acanthamoeba castellanii mimivirus]|uniref:Uncharacterized protein R44 n=5 Tax=Mimivirus TaxID=315393 RepID=YR044_MIMIV|nr:hypothetical protein MIMI_gp0055 [Acanthamoeba polyphaga mimivirus]Q5UPB7.1 RecName: Full=Uncharacterized protein R44 [Acanthamoeba polyphaga mimivirus]AHA45839.1 hypothetical protein HIRU_S933 [Hirudovirus strain Sangsue]AMZ02495.1 hypothetical protein [Mimivirus Bombay]EJN41250.1 hypothetical protein lvs_R21 [Acanthamoeba polyphaga lentillevirus]BAV61123.1 hypothetical protein [Acanthamoeba castellanii mimivirus]AAV50319.1 unknown [Acanthamoeba polyphaga mimivirus]